jgi:predicted metal-dependent HD superfamily phosphohydrolase
MSNHIYKKIETYVTGLFNTMGNDKLVFHNLEHTRGVVDRTKEIAGHYKLGDKEMLIVFAAAWFHDTGHLFTDATHHEEMSVEVMKKFMVEQNTGQDIIDGIERCILATRFPRNPQDRLEQIICDADMYNLGTKEFKKTNKKVKKELQLTDGEFDEEKYLEKTLDLLKKHHFYTEYCRDLLSDQKKKNIAKLENKLEDVHKIADELPDGENLSDLRKDKSGLMSKGIQTMLRLTSENHLKLSDMADHKANILISVNSIIISVILSVLLRKLQDEPYLTIPSIIFLLVAVTTIVISILATRPKISGGKFTAQDVLDKKTNLLFFGNFHRAGFEEYNSAMRNMMIDTDYLYGSLIKDIYHLGTVLGRKYRLIRLAYNIFMVGIIISVVAFGLAVLLHGNVPEPTTTVNGTGSPL